LAGTEVYEPGGKRAGRPELRHQAEVDEGHLEIRAFARVDEIAVRQHGRSTPDRRAVDGGDQRLVEVDERIHQARLGRLTGPWRALQEIHHIVARTERVSRAVPEHDANLLVLRRRIEKLREGDVHVGCHRVLLLRTVQLDPQDASGAFGEDVTHRPPPGVTTSGCLTPRMVRLAWKPSISEALNPSCSRTCSLCSPSAGARLAGTLVTPCT